MKRKLLEWITGERTALGRTSAGLAGGGIALAFLGQPIDSILGGIGILAIVIGAIVAFVLGLPKFATVKGKGQIMAGGAALVVGVFMLGIFGMPAWTAALTPQQPPSGTWLACLTNANGATIGLGTCSQSLVGAKAVLKSQSVPTSNYYVYFNMTVTPPSGTTQVAYNVIVQTGSVPSLTNTSAPSQTGPVVALRTGGQYDVKITPASGTATYQMQVVPLTSGTSKVIAFEVHYSTMIGLLSLGQYPVGVTVTFSITDQNSGASYGSISLSTTFT